MVKHENFNAKTIVQVEIPFLEETGYGPSGKYTRDSWRKICLEKLQLGKDEFYIWQNEILNETQNFLSNSELKSFACELKLSNDEHLTVNATGIPKDATRFRKMPCFSLDFSGIDFFEPNTFNGYYFVLPVIFSWSKFFDFVKFTESTFARGAEFTGVRFMHHVNFEKLNLGNILFNISYSYFKIFSDFSNTNFPGETLFNNVEFEQSVHFKNTTFEKHAVFTKCKFNSFVSYEFATFKDKASFQSSMFNGYAVFNNAEFWQNCNFSNIFNGIEKKWTPETRFTGFSSFENAKFKNVGHFERVHFTKHIPSFLGVDTSTTRLEFSSDDYFTKDDISEDAIKQLGQLKRLSDEHGQTDQALNFNALELNAKAKQTNAGWGIKTFTWLYDHVSNFGRSFTQPLGIYSIILFFTFLIALEHSAYNAPRNYTQQGCEKYVSWIERVTWIEDKNCSEKPNALQLTGIRAAGEYTLYRAAGILDFADSDKQTKEVAQRLFGQEIEPWWMRIWGIFKAIASTALLFLAALGLRNKYRIK